MEPKTEMKLILAARLARKRFLELNEQITKEARDGNYLTIHALDKALEAVESERREINNIIINSQY